MPTKEKSRLAAIVETIAYVAWALACIASIMGLAAVFFGCSAVPQTAGQWRKELRDRAAFARAGLEYKGPHALRAEVQDMRRAVADVTFSPMSTNKKATAAKSAVPAKSKGSAIVNAHPNLVQIVREGQGPEEKQVPADATATFADTICKNLKAEGYNVTRRNFDSSGKVIVAKAE